MCVCVCMNACARVHTHAFVCECKHVHTKLPTLCSVKFTAPLHSTPEEGLHSDDLQTTSTPIASCHSHNACSSSTLPLVMSSR